MSELRAILVAAVGGLALAAVLVALVALAGLPVSVALAVPLLLLVGGPLYALFAGRQRQPARTARPAPAPAPAGD